MENIFILKGRDPTSETHYRGLRLQGSLTTGQKVSYLDGWRGLAILCVLCNHFGPGFLQDMGSFGVLLFFVLSGYFMSQLLFIRKIELPTFFARRFSRVLPTFWLFTCAMAIYAATFQPQIFRVSLKELASTLFFLRTYLPVDVSIWADHWSIGHFWSLNVEEHSYVYLALGAFLCAKVGLKNGKTAARMFWFGGAVLAICLFAFWYWDVDLHFYVFWALGFILLPKSVSMNEETAARWFLLGSTVVVLGIIFFYLLFPPSGVSLWYLRSECASLGLIASAAYRVYRHGPSLSRETSHPYRSVVALALSAFLFAPFIPYHGLLSHTVSPLLAAFSINHFQEASELFRRLLSNGVLRWFGVCSYSIYLWQEPFYQLVKHNGGSQIVCVISAVVIGSLSFYFFENPIRLRLNRWWEQHPLKRVGAVVGTSE
jgi:peptidoglycan/LPS O-acetylase OafA/YrhL